MSRTLLRVGHDGRSLLCAYGGGRQGLSRVEMTPGVDSIPETRLESTYAQAGRVREQKLRVADGDTYTKRPKKYYRQGQVVRKALLGGVTLSGVRKLGVHFTDTKGNATHVFDGREACLSKKLEYGDFGLLRDDVAEGLGGDVHPT
ncbi:uncharacterized protein UV8b_06041 [Ustilaginoidea virens]|uniref:Uncharacterized protein n=1 Tax=Ustilaginoidea virens TaxID=1159556 RepID=A0A063BW61_USTVR|nr:uncharacterized protein UV8b_06041 [Ustilaginoidea virens]QUC21800.1 hypothetical protein UV8b_06041 [Ustilaginoidea virens]GAO19884.1 hypothetical protein UVI_02051120 [Ustilaginoidea virens]